MLDFWTKMKETYNYTTTENGAIALKSTMNKCLDAFGTLGAMKKSPEDLIWHTFQQAFLEDRTLAMRMLFYMRDIRGGQGARRVFRMIVKNMAQLCPNYVIDNLDNFLFYGRGDDLLCLLDTPIKRETINYIGKKLAEDVEKKAKHEPVSLLAKWLPSENTSSQETRHYARQIINGLPIKPRIYRKVLADLRQYIDVTERKMSAREWTEIKYDTVPAKAAVNYGNAFMRHDEEGYKNYLLNVAEGKAKVNAKSLFPVDILSKVLNGSYYGMPRNVKEKDRILYNAMWNSLPNYFEGKEETGICMVDTSGSMYYEPYEVALSLGLYCADKCKGPYKGKFITFAENPRLVEVNGENIYDKVSGIQCINAGNTDIEAAFDLILKTAIQNHCMQDEIPSKLYIISDMQFDEARGGKCHYSWGRFVKEPPKPFMQTMREKYAAYGYELPTIVYWNVRANQCGMFQQTFEGENCAMVSGYSPSLFKAVIEGTTYEEEIHADGSVSLKAKVDPITVMLNTLGNERYDRVIA